MRFWRKKYFPFRVRMKYLTYSCSSHWLNSNRGLRKLNVRFRVLVQILIVLGLKFQKIKDIYGYHQKFQKVNTYTRPDQVFPYPIVWSMQYGSKHLKLNSSHLGPVLFILLQDLERRSSYGGPINTFINTTFEVMEDQNPQVLKCTAKFRKKTCKSQQIFLFP